MLEIIKAEIKSEYPDFDIYYMDYICSVQDENIEREFRYFRNANQLNAGSMQYIIDHTYEELRKLDFNKRPSKTICQDLQVPDALHL